MMRTTGLLALWVTTTRGFVPSRRVAAVRLRSGNEDLEDLSPEELASYGEKAPTAAEEAELFAMLKDKFAACVVRVLISFGPGQAGVVSFPLSGRLSS